MTKIDLGVNSRHSHAFNKHSDHEEIGRLGAGRREGGVVGAHGVTWEGALESSRHL